ncbi:MAG: FHA domain-containing protein [Gammaproteobacteria bacterium]|nr:FHA domain-containing protein [Gammaproteobacteria bacterium]
MVNQGHEEDGGSEVKRFGSHLASLVKVPSARIAEFVDSSALELQQQLAVLDDVDGRFEAILLTLRRDPEQGLEAFSRLDLRIVSRDHGWRDILAREALRQPDGLPFLVVALEKYIEYLHFRRRLLEFILERRAVMETESRTDVSPFMATLHDVARRETSAFDRPARDLGAMASDVYRRLPPREAYPLHISEGEEMTLVMAGHSFRMSRTAEVLNLTDENGAAYQLPSGSHSVGRSRDCDVVLDPNLREVSRKHLVIDWDGQSALTLMDVSHLGTFVPKQSAG